MREPRILLVDDEVSIQRAVAPLLRSRGYDVEVVALGADAVRAVELRPPDLMVLDLGLPDIDGPEVCRRIRIEIAAADHRAVGARLGERQGVGARFGRRRLHDETVRTRRSSSRACALRCGACFRRNRAETGQVQRGGLTIDYDRRRVVRDGEEIRLTPKEFELLSLLINHADRVMTHRAILKAIWGPNAVDQPEHLWVLMAQLRKKVERNPAAPQYLVSEPWVGYRFVTEAS